MTKGTVLVVDDERKILSFVSAYLKREGFEVITAGDGASALAAWREQQPRLIVLDLLLPKIDGLEVCREIRKSSSVPIIMLTAKDEESDKVVGLELGADDYLTKPFSPRELVARVKAVLRRAQAGGTPDRQSHFGSLVIDRTGREVIVSGQHAHLTKIEFDVLDLLASNRGRAFTREEILQSLWGETYVGDMRVVDVHMRRLREKIERDASAPEFVHTVWGIGYKFDFGED